MKNAKLLPCPFCGNRDVKCLSNYELDRLNHISGKGLHDFVQYLVICDDTDGGCGVRSKFENTEERAIERWNKREGGKV